MYFRSHCRLDGHLDDVRRRLSALPTVARGDAKPVP